MKKRYPFLLCLLTSVLLISPAKAQNYDINKLKIIADITIQNNKEFDYIRFNESQLSNIGSLITIDSSITDQNSQKPLVIDIRINKKLNTDYHTNTFFDYFISMFLSEPLMLSQQISREHFGWDEWND